MRDLYMTSGDGFILVYSIIARSTYNDLPDLRRQILQVKDRDEVPMVLVGNKCDAEDQRQVSRDEAQRLVDKWGSSVSFFETSAKQALRVGDVFNDLTRRLIEARRSGKDGKKKKKRNSRDSGASSRCTLF
jgi:small GTP-binding protein